MEDLFDTYDEAKAHLEIKRAKLYKDIADRGDIIIEDRSFAGNCFSYTHPEKFRAFMLLCLGNRPYRPQQNRGFAFPKHTTVPATTTTRKTPTLSPP